MKRLSAYKLILTAILPVVASAILGSCNSKDSDEPAYEPAESVAVTKFSLSPNKRVLDDLDSVYFSIDLTRGIIFNADSLPKGTRIDKLVPVITYPAAVKKAIITMEGGETRQGTVDYTNSPSDSIDFTGRVTLTLSTSDNALSRTYQLKVNVHKMVADSLMWDKVAVASLPSRSSSPKAQRTVSLGDKIYTLIQETDNSYTLSTCLNPSDNNWEKKRVNLPFTPAIRSLTASDNALYILSTNGELYTSADGQSWQSTSTVWHSLIGGFGSTVVGILSDNGGYSHDIYPRPDGYTPVPVTPEFPIDGISEFHTFTSKWSTDPIGYFVGGSRNGKLTGATWSFDGTNWACTSNTPLPAIESPLLIPYFNYRKTATSWLQTEYSVMLCLGGRLADGSINRDVYLSYDNGVNWQKASSLLQLPDFIPPVESADAVIRTTPMQASLDAYWQNVNTVSPSGVKRIQYFVDGSDVDWECPYIYLFGGVQSSGTLNDAILRAVLARLTFSPLF